MISNRFICAKRKALLHRTRTRTAFCGVTFVAAAVMFALQGCTVQHSKTGDAEHVQLHTPVGGLEVRTDAAHAPDVGLPVYPGAVETGKRGSDSGSADIHMNFGHWHLNVKAAEYRSSDPENKIIAFYKDAMRQYGDVLTCKDKTAIGNPARTRQGLTCAQDHEVDVDVKLHSKTVLAPTLDGNIKLLAGSPEDQHIVEFRPDSAETRFSLVMVQLPHKSSTD
jgi:hypothetical protein